MLNRRSFLTMALTGLAVLAAPALMAQIAPAPYITVHFDNIHPEQSESYEANGRDWVASFKEAGVSAENGWDGYNADFTYAWVSDMTNWAELDGQADRQKAVVETVGEEKFGALMTGANDAVASHHTEVWKFEPELSYFAADFNPTGMKAINVGTQYVKPGKEEDFQKVLEDAVAALKKVEAPVHFLTYRIAFGQGTFAFVSWGEDRAALHSGPPMGALLGQALGAEGAQALFERWTATISSASDKDWRVRPDLTYRPDREMAPAPE